MFAVCFSFVVDFFVNCLMHCCIVVLRCQAVEIHAIHSVQFRTAAVSHCVVRVCPKLGGRTDVVVLCLKSSVFRLWYHADLLSVFTEDCVIFSSELNCLCFAAQLFGMCVSCGTCSAMRPCGRPSLCHRIVSVVYAVCTIVAWSSDFYHIHYRTGLSNQSYMRTLSNRVKSILPCTWTGFCGFDTKFDLLCQRSENVYFILLRKLHVLNSVVSLHNSFIIFLWNS